MTIKQLKNALENVDDNLEVYVYASEAEDWGGNITVRVLNRDTDGFPYCKGDEPGNLSQAFVILDGYPY